MASSKYASSLTKICPLCGFQANLKGFASHERACRTRLEKETASKAFSDQMIIDEEIRILHPANVDSQGADHGVTVQDVDMLLDVEPPHQDLSPFVETQDNIAEGFSDSPLDSTQSESQGPFEFSPGEHADTDDLMKVEYHPLSGRADEYLSLYDYRQRRQKVRHRVEEEPWLPFSTRIDYEFSDIILDAGMNARQSNSLILLLHRVIKGEKFTLKNYAEIQKRWKEASSKLAKFTEEKVTVPFKEEQRTFSVYYRPVWDWACDIMKNPKLSASFELDARRLYRYSSKTKTFIRFYDEPWTGDRLWELQSKMKDSSSKIFPLIVYADKSKISSFGTQKGYPVVARCGLLPVAICNGTGLGGGAVVGWLPVIPETAEDNGKPIFANFKCAVWHKSMGIIFDSVKTVAKIGQCVDWDSQKQLIMYPRVVVVSSDYEEQSVFALTRGNNCKRPCSTCVVPRTKLTQIVLYFKPRTQEGSQKTYKDALECSTKKEKEKVMKKKGLRFVENVFWSLESSDVHKAVSWDRLHGYNNGIFSDHIWELFKSVVEEMGRAVQTVIDERFGKFPRWRDFYHFDSALKITFNDGKKFEDLSKQLLYVAHNSFERSKKSPGYILLRILRSYVELDTFLAFDVQTEETISAGRQEMANFARLIELYTKVAKDTTLEKNWNFIKMHLQSHAYEDIMAKGVTRNYNTKPNEKLHGPLRDIYHERTNFRDVAKQILEISHQMLVSLYMRGQLQTLDAFSKQNNEGDSADSDDEFDLNNLPRTSTRVKGPILPPSDKYHLGALRHEKLTISSVKENNAGDVAFKDFRKRLTVFANNYVAINKLPLPSNVTYIRLAADDELYEYRLLKVFYESKATWDVCVDFLRCNPKFFGHPRYDCVLIRTVDKFIFARLVLIFAIKIGGSYHPIALVRPFDAYLGPRRRKDKELGLYRVGMKTSSEFVPLRSIVRGALLVPDFDEQCAGEFIVVDVIDSDMFLRVREMQGRYSSSLG